MTASETPSILAYSPDAQMRGAVWVHKGAEISPVTHGDLLADRIGRLLELCDDPEEVRTSAERDHFAPAGLYFGGNLKIDQVAINWVSAILTTPFLSLQGATVNEKTTVLVDNPEAREHLESELEDPEQAILTWVACATYVSPDHDEITESQREARDQRETTFATSASRPSKAIPLNQRPTESPNQQMAVHGRSGRIRHTKVGTMMIRYLKYVALIGGVGYAGYYLWHGLAESTNEAAARDTQRKERRVSVAAEKEAQQKVILEMARKDDAVVNWARNIIHASSNGDRRVLTAELQKQWLIGRPILFVGRLDDIWINPDGSYQVVVNYDSLGKDIIFLGAYIQVSFTCPETVGTVLFGAIQKRNHDAFDPDVAITGRIHRVARTQVAEISKAEETDPSGDKIEVSRVLTGFGDCISAMFLRKE